MLKQHQAVVGQFQMEAQSRGLAYQQGRLNNINTPPHYISGLRMFLRCITCTLHAPLHPEVCIFFPLFFTEVYIVERLVLQIIYVLNKEILQCLGLEFAIYNWEQFQIKNGFLACIQYVEKWLYMHFESPAAPEKTSQLRRLFKISNESLGPYLFVECKFWKF